MRKANLNLIRISLFVIVLSIFFAFLTAYAEKDSQPEFWNIYNIGWWWLCTVSSVGYGDLIPVTASGKIFASFVILSSFIVLGLIIVEFNYYLRVISNKGELGFRKIKHKNHTVIIGKNAFIDSLISYLHRTEHSNIVVVSERLINNPFEEVELINGNPKDGKTIIRSNLQYASKVIILAEENINNPDANTLIIANEIERLYPNVVTIGELVDKRFEPIFAEANLDYFVTEEFLIKGIKDDSAFAELLSNKR